MANTVEARYWPKVDKRGPDDCWEWTAAKTVDGYGVLTVRRKLQKYAHRLAWEFHTGAPIPNGMFVCHHCDNPSCCNPAHLFLGTPASNSADMVKKGRAASQTGEQSPNHILTKQAVIEIRRVWSNRITYRELGERYGVSKQAIAAIVKNGSAGGFKVSKAEAVAIKSEYERRQCSQYSLAKQYGVAKGTIYGVTSGRRWSHADERKGELNDRDRPGIRGA